MLIAFLKKYFVHRQIVFNIFSESGDNKRILSVETFNRELDMIAIYSCIYLHSKKVINEKQLHNNCKVH